MLELTGYLPDRDRSLFERVLISAGVEDAAGWALSDDSLVAPDDAAPDVAAAVAAIFAPRVRTSADRLAELAAVRYAREVAGITVDGLPVATDRESRINLIAMESAAARGLRQDGACWKFADGVARQVSNAAIQAIAMCVMGYVQSCFERERVLAEQINAAAHPMDVEILDGWPATAFTQDE